MITHFHRYKFFEPFDVISTHAISRHNEVIYIPIFKIFQQKFPHKFYIYNIDKSFDGLIGTDLLKKLNAKIDLEHQLLTTPIVKIPIHYQVHTPIVLYLQPRTEHRVTIPTELTNGEGILDFVEFCEGVRMPQALITCKDNFTETIIQNTTDNFIKIEITKPFKITEFNGTRCHLNYFLDNNDKLLEENLNKLRTNHMSHEEKDAISKICYEYKDIFYHEDIPLTFTHEIKHHIRTENDNPIYVKQYRQSPSQAKEIRNQVEKLLQDNVIKPSFSPWSAPVHLVPKKLDASNEQKYRMVIDYRKLNEITTDDKYPLPNISDIFDKLGNSSYFTTLDLASGYHQIEILESDQPKTAFSTQFGHYEFYRMPFGLKTAPATFQRAMDNILKGLQGVHCMIYLDDIIIFSSTLEEHISKLTTVFQTLRKANLKIQLDKSEFFRKEVLYLGHTITKEGLKPNEDKVISVLRYPLPRTQKEIKSFLGLLGYYRRFIPDFAKITKPMTSFLKKGVKFEATKEYKEAFETCKSLLTNAPLLQYPDFSKPFILTTDASNIALGAVLSQGTIGQDKPIAYASRTLLKPEENYSTIEKELLAVLWAVRHFRPYLYGKKFFIYTDHRPLAWLYSLSEPNSKLTRWRLKLQEFDFKTLYKAGKQNSNADALSRIKINTLTTNEPHSSNQLNYDSEETMTASDSENIDIEELYDDTISIIPTIEEAIDHKSNQIITHQWYNNEYKIKKIPHETRNIIEVYIAANPKIIKSFLKNNTDNKKKYFIHFETSKLRETFNEVITQLSEKESIQLIECTKRVTILENEEEQKDIIMKYHTGKTCHRGINETLTRLKRNYYWPGMKETVSAIINACDLCKRMKYDRQPLKPKLQLTQTQNKPFEELFIDLFSIEGKIYLTIIDAFSKLGQAIEISNRSTPEVVKALIKYFSYYGTPNKISSDPGSEFNNSLLKELLAFYKIELHIGTPNNPNSMGIIERFHSTLIEIYRLAKYEQKPSDASSVMTYAIIAYNNSIHSVTNLTPFEVVFGHTDSNDAFDVDFQRNYMQHLMKDHAKRTAFLYKYLTDKTIKDKEKRNDDSIGENITFNKGEIIYSKLVNKRRAKDTPRYEKAVVTGETSRNIVPVQIRNRETTVPVKNIRNPIKINLSCIIDKLCKRNSSQYSFENKM